MRAVFVAGVIAIATPLSISTMAADRTCRVECRKPDPFLHVAGGTVGIISGAAALLFKSEFRRLGRGAVSATIRIDRFQCADNYLISVSQEHVNEPEAGWFEQADPTRDRHVVSNAIGMAGAQ